MLTNARRTVIYGGLGGLIGGKGSSLAYYTTSGDNHNSEKGKWIRRGSTLAGGGLGVGLAEHLNARDEAREIAKLKQRLKKAGRIGLLTAGGLGLGSLLYSAKKEDPMKKQSSSSLDKVFALAEKRSSLQKTGGPVGVLGALGGAGLGGYALGDRTMEFDPYVTGVGALAGGFAGGGVGGKVDKGFSALGRGLKALKREDAEALKRAKELKRTRMLSRLGLVGAGAGILGYLGKDWTDSEADSIARDVVPTTHLIPTGSYYKAASLLKKKILNQ